MSKTKVIMKDDDGHYGEWKKGEKGYIDGYCRAGNDCPYAVVVIGNRIVYAPNYALEVIQEPTNKGE